MTFCGKIFSGEIKEHKIMSFPYCSFYDCEKKTCETLYEAVQQSSEQASDILKHKYYKMEYENFSGSKSTIYINSSAEIIETKN